MQQEALNRFIEQNPILFAVILFVVTAWTLYWKGMALWKAAKLDKQEWFIVLLLVHTLGILEILYLYVFSKKHEEQKQIN